MKGSLEVGELWGKLFTAPEQAHEETLLVLPHVSCVELLQPPCNHEGTSLRIKTRCRAENSVLNDATEFASPGAPVSLLGFLLGT